MAGTVAPRIATESEFDAWLALRNYSIVVAADKPFLLQLAFDYMGTLAFCQGTAEDLITGQLFLAYALANGFDPVSPVDGKSLIEKGLGRSAIVKKWSINALTAGTDSVSMLRKSPMAFNQLMQYLCVESLVVADPTGISNFEVSR